MPPTRPAPRVHKFGGASLADGAAMKHAVNIIELLLDGRTCIVVSAMGGVTDRLLSLANGAAAGRERDPVSLEAFHHARAADRLRADLVVDGERYRTTLPMRRPGVWEIRVQVERGAERFSTVLQREVGGLP